MKKYLFLDIDGVLNCTKIVQDWVDAGSPEPRPDFHGDELEIMPEKIKLLKMIVEETGCEIILSSSWRVIKGQFERLNKNFEPFGIKIVDRTCYCVNMPVRDSRCRDWKDTFINACGDRVPAHTYDRGAEVLEYLKDHPADKYVVLDDEMFDILNWIDDDHAVYTDTFHGLSYGKARECIYKLNNDFTNTD